MLILWFEINSIFVLKMVRRQKSRPDCDKFLSSRCIRLMHYNIEGAVSEAHGNKMSDDDFLSIVNGHDLCAFTETHASEDTNLNIPGYVVKRKTRPKSAKARKYSGGIALAIKHNLANHIEMIKSKSDNIMWARLNLAGCKKDLLVGIVYISPINSSYTKNVLDSPFKTWEILNEELTKFKLLYNVCLVGDFNARTGTLPDYVVNDDDKHVDLPLNYSVDTVRIKRNNCDESINSYGNHLIDLCQMSEMRIVNGSKFGDSTGKKTCHQWNGSSTVDYMVADLFTYPLIQSFRVIDMLNHLSDHCPISAVINLDVTRVEQSIKCCSYNTPKNIK